jgi:hypothetical protein
MSEALAFAEWSRRMPTKWSCAGAKRKLAANEEGCLRRGEENLQRSGIAEGAVFQHFCCFKKLMYN